MLMAGAGAKQAQAALEGVAASSKKAGSEIAKGKSSLQNYGSALSKLGAVSAGITAAVGVAINSFVEQNRFTDASAHKWSEASRDLKASYNSIGKVLTDQIVPYMETAAKLAQTWAEWGMKNPQLVGAIAKGAAVVTATTMTGATIGSVVPGVGTAAGGGLGALGGLSAVIGGSLANPLFKMLLPNLYNQLDSTKSQRPSLTELLTGDTAKFKAGGVPSDMAGNVDATTTALAKMNNVLQAEPEIMQAWINYQRQETQAANQYIVQQSKASRDYYRQETIAYQDFGRQQGIASRNYSRQQGIAEQDYFKQRRIASRDFNIEIARSEQDRQKTILRASEDHNYKLFSIIRSGDAMAYWQEQYSYNKEQSRAGEDFSIEQQRKKEDFAKTQADEAAQFSAERSRAAEEFAIQQSDAETAFGVERQKAHDQFVLQQQDAELQYNIDKALRKQNFILSLSQFANEETQVATLRAQFTAASLQQMQTMYEQYLSGQPIQIPQMSNPYGALQSGGISGGGYSVVQNNTFSRGMTPEDKASTRNMVYDLLSGFAG